MGRRTTEAPDMDAYAKTQYLSNLREPIIQFTTPFLPIRCSAEWSPNEPFGWSVSSYEE
jgi:hypothetical protein